LRQGVKWHDGRPFSAKDVKCTWDLLTGQSSEKLRLNPRKSWYRNLQEVTTNGDFEVTFHLRRPQPAFIALLAAGFSVVYPCHVAPNEMRQHPIGTGPFKFVEFKPNERITVTRNPDYWKRGRPYLDGIEFPIIREVSTANLAFIAGSLDWIAPTIPLIKNVRSQAPQAICEVTAGGISRNLVINRDAPPFDNPDMRRAMALSLDRKSFIDILSEGYGDIGGAMQPLPEGVWGMPPDIQNTLPGYDPDVQRNRSEARTIMRKLGYGPDNRLALKVSTRNVPPFRDPAVILIDQLKDVFIEGELEIVETALWYPKMYRKDYKIGLNLTGGGVDDPDQQFYENYACGSARNYTDYCSPELEALFERQSAEADEGKRKRLVWEIERKLSEDGARPIIFYNRFAYCWQAPVKNWTMMVNNIINNFRLEDVWLDR
jgi:peptide/nickel transport system substrate-binding protein